jgi:hypothetical protein
METVPPVPDACEEEVLEAQSKLIDIAQGIETVFVEINWLRGPFEDSCLELEPELEAVMNTNIQDLDFFTEERINNIYGQLYQMSKGAGESFDDFKLRTDGLFEA